MTKLSRRAFARNAMVAAAAAAVLPSATGLAAEEALPAAAQAEIEARIAWILGRYGSWLDDQQKADVRRLVSGSASGFEQLRSFPVDNAIEPATPFRVWRAPKRAFVPRVEKPS